jgi:hypothetical protein
MSRPNPTRHGRLRPNVRAGQRHGRRRNELEHGYDELAGRRIYQSACVCGWRSGWQDTPALAESLLTLHLA